MRLLILQICAIYSIQAVENPIPSSFLQPRDFNPHPYQIEASNFLIAPERIEDYRTNYDMKYLELTRRFQNTGPVQFPGSPDSQIRQLQQQEQQRRIVSHIVDKQALVPNPYERLALNYRAQQLQRYSVKDERTPQIFSALEQHGRKVQNNEFQRKQIFAQVKLQNKNDEEFIDPIRTSSLKNEKKHYRFSYAVKDGHSGGDDFSHSQKQENGAVQGSYKVHLPDGRVQVVKYTADDIHGYRAEVSYEGEARLEEPRSAPFSITQQRVYYSPTSDVKQVEINNIRHTVTPSPYFGGEYNLRAPALRNYYPTTTAIPRHFN